MSSPCNASFLLSLGDKEAFIPGGNDGYQGPDMAENETLAKNPSPNKPPIWRVHSRRCGQSATTAMHEAVIVRSMAVILIVFSECIVQ